MEDSKQLEVPEPPELGSACPAVAAPFGAAMRAHHETAWPQQIALQHVSDGSISWVSTGVWFGQDPFREQILDDLIPQISGPVLDVGAGAGRAALKLQAAGIDVLALDCEPACVAIARANGVVRVELADIRTIETEERFRTILFMDSTFGLAGDVDSIGPLLRKLESLLSPDGRVLVQDQDLGIPVRELEWRFMYRDLVGKPFRWMNFGYFGLRLVAAKHGWQAERVLSGPGACFVAELRPRAAKSGIGAGTWGRWLLAAAIVAAVVAAGAFLP